MNKPLTDQNILRACSHGGGGPLAGEIPPPTRGQKKLGLHMQPRGAGVRFKMLSRGIAWSLTFGVFLLNFLADLESSILSSEEAFRFAVLAGTLQLHPTDPRPTDQLDYQNPQVHCQLLQNFLR